MRKGWRFAYIFGHINENGKIWAKLWDSLEIADDE